MKKFIFALLFVAVFHTGTAFAQPLIIIVGNTPAGTAAPNTDQSLIDFLNTIYAPGEVTIEYDTTRYTGGTAATNLGGLPASEVTHLNTAALIIISPSADSSTSFFQQVDTQAAWNSLTAPLMVMTTGRVVGNERFRWIDAAGTNNSGPLTLTIPGAVQSDPIFTGTTITSGTLTYYTTATPQHVTQGLVAGTNFELTAPNTGTVLAWGSATVPFVVRWTQSATPFYAASPYNPVANRWLVNLLNVPSGGNSRIFDSIAIMTEDGKQLLENIITSEVPATPPPNKVKDWTLF